MKLVKSVVRVVEILKLFHAEQKPLPAIDIAKRLNYPLASTHELLKTLVKLGFFTYGYPKHMYRPSNQFPEVVEWVRESLCDDPKLAGFMDALNVATRENIVLCGRIGNHAKVFGSLHSLHEFGTNTKRGTLLSLTESLLGMTLLSHLDNDALDAFYERLRSSSAVQYGETDRRLVERVVSEVQSHGVCQRFDFEIDGIGSICCPIVSSSSVDGLVIGIIGPSRRLKSEVPNHLERLASIAEEFGVQTRFPLQTLYSQRSRLVVDRTSE